MSDSPSLSRFPFPLPARSVLLVSPVECDLCRRVVGAGEGYHTLTLGMDEAPKYVGVPLALASVVESTHEVNVCTRCEPASTRLLHDLMTALWALRAEEAPDPSAGGAPDHSAGGARDNSAGGAREPTSQRGDAAPHLRDCEVDGAGAPTERSTSVALPLGDEARELMEEAGPHTAYTGAELGAFDCDPSEGGP